MPAETFTKTRAQYDKADLKRDGPSQEQSTRALVYFLQRPIRETKYAAFIMLMMCVADRGRATVHRLMRNTDFLVSTLTDHQSSSKCTVHQLIPQATLLTPADADWALHGGQENQSLVLQVLSSGYAKPQRPLMLEMEIPDKGVDLRLSVVARSHDPGMDPIFLVAFSVLSQFPSSAEILALVTSPEAAATAVLFPNSSGHLSTSMTGETLGRNIAKALKAAGYEKPPPPGGLEAAIGLLGWGMHGFREVHARNVTQYQEGLDLQQIALHHVGNG